MALTAQLNIVNHIFSHVVKKSWCAYGLFLTAKHLVLYVVIVLLLLLLVLLLRTTRRHELLVLQY